jgi:hypothetical protein
LFRFKNTNFLKLAKPPFSGKSMKPTLLDSLNENNIYSRTTTVLIVKVCQFLMQEINSGKWEEKLT